MNPTIHIAVIISAITLVGMAAIAVNYSPTPAHAVPPENCQWVIPGLGGTGPCFTNRHDCEQALQNLPPGSTFTCFKAKK